MRDNFHIGVLRFHEAWGENYLLIHANVVIRHSMTDAVSLYCSVRFNTVSFRMSSFMVLYVEFLHTISPSAKHVPSPLSTYFILITCLLLHTSVSLYTDGSWSLFSKEAGILYGSVYLMLWTGGLFLLALLLTRCRFVFRALSLIYK